MTNDYYKKVEASMIWKFLGKLSIMCGDSVVLSGVKLYLKSRDKIVVNVSSQSSDYA